MKVKECKIETDGNDIFVIADGVTIAKRGHPGTLQARTWIALEPGWIVRDCRGPVVEDGDEGAAIEIEYHGARVH